MDSVFLRLSLTPHGRLVLDGDAGAAGLEAGLAERLQGAFGRGPGHGLLLLGADAIATALPPVPSYWREFAARYVTTLCTRQDGDAPPKKVRVAAPPDEELALLVLAAPPMTGAEYLTSAVLRTLWHEFVPGVCDKKWSCRRNLIFDGPQGPEAKGYQDE